MTDRFPSLLKEAAEEFSNQCSAFAQFRAEPAGFKARLQAVEIMQQFVGDVTFGKDPKGVLFFRNGSDFKLSSVKFVYEKFAGPNNTASVRVNFTDGRSTTAKPFARFLARFDTTKYHIPLDPTAGGNGKWFPFKAATAQVDALRQDGEKTLYLQVNPIRKEISFQTVATASIDGPGLLIFKDLSRLTEKPLGDQGDDRLMQADFAPDRIVFSIKPRSAGDKNVEFGLFLPIDPMAKIGAQPAQPPNATFTDFEPTSSFALNAEAHEAAELKADD